MILVKSNSLFSFETIPNQTKPKHYIMLYKYNYDMFKTLHKLHIYSIDIIT